MIDQLSNAAPGLGCMVVGDAVRVGQRVRFMVSGSV